MNTYEEFLKAYGGPPEKDFFKLSVEDKTAIIYNQVTKRIAELRELGRLAPEQNLDPMGIVAQILTETGNATSPLVKKANNFGGLVADKGWKGAKSPSGKYRSYSTPEEGLRAQVDFYIENPRYAKAGALNAKNAEEHLQAVTKAGYAESPNYLENTLKTLKSIPSRLEKANKELLQSFEMPEKSTNFNTEPFIIKQSGANDPLLLEHPVNPIINYDINNTLPSDINLLNPPIEVPPPGDSPMYNNGGTMNFKSNAAYHKYLGYIYANNLNKPGGAPVTIKGKHHEVDREDQYGGYLMGEGGGITPVGYPFNNATFKAFGFANGGPFNNKGFKNLPAEVQAKIRANSFAEGGQMEPLTEFNAGGRHEENPLGGIPQGMAPDGQPNLVEQGETKLNSADYIFSDRLKLDKQTVEEFNLPKTLIGKTFADASKKADRPDSRRENDSIEMKAKEKELNTLMEAQEAFKAKEVAKKMEEIASLDPTALQGMQMPGSTMPQQGMPQMPQMGMPQGMPVDPNQIPPEMLAQMPAAQQGAPIMAMGGHVYMCGGHRYDFGSFLKGAGEFATNYGKGLVDATLTGFGAGDVIKYKEGTVGAEAAEKIAGIAGKVNQVGMQIAGNVLLPGVGGKAVSAMQQGIGQATAQPQEVPQDPMAAQKTPEQIAEEQRQQQLNNLNTQYGNLNPTGFNAQVMAGGGHMYDGNPFYSSFMQYKPNYTSQADNILGNPMESDYTNPLTGESYLGFNSGGNAYNNTGLGDGFNITTSNNKNKSVNTYDTDLDAIDNKKSITGSPLTTLGELGSMGYNAYMGFINKPKTYTGADFYTAPQLKEIQKLNPNLVNLERLNYRPALEATERTAAGAMKGLREAGDAGSYLNNLATVQNVYGDTTKATAMQGENINTELGNKERLYNQQIKQDTAKYNAGLDQYLNQLKLSIADQEARAKTMATDVNWKTQAARQAHQQQVFSDLFNLGNANTGNQIGLAYANMQASPGQGINYTPWLQSLFANIGKG